MKKFLLKLSLFYIILYLLTFLIITTSPEVKNPSNYLSAIIDKHNIAKNIKTPKVIFSGGSNTAFGIDSEMLSNNFKIPIINLGLHGGLGLAFILEETKSILKQGDIVILSIEYFLEREGEYDLKEKTSNFYPPANKFYSHNYFIDFKNYLKKTEKSFKRLINKEENNTNKNSDSILKIYRRDGFNNYGDLISHLNKPKLKNLKSQMVFEYKYWEGIELINKFSSYARSKDVKVYFTYPAYAESEYKKNLLAISKLEKDIRNNLNIEILNTPKDFTFPDNNFFDSVFHLNKEGRRKRTNKFISLIRNNKDLSLYLDSIKKNHAK
ncbi:hypothetical protein [Polaribacter aquimarinus]|uniref:DUF1574 domain-containing protein n=1 Tax=Polaribacter aquimarinus TaxID=2100726 RepID=A0A2U2J748_9FLAO|nr:hypothetical protein [Polaribacter aquimarinus]PWG04158.1 hypothetical protein DIS07_14425 [Polaribacter aquimarinus]